jgi:hypothetical protein
MRKRENWTIYRRFYEKFLFSMVSYNHWQYCSIYWSTIVFSYLWWESIVIMGKHIVDEKAHRRWNWMYHEKKICYENEINCETYFDWQHFWEIVERVFLLWWTISFSGMMCIKFIIWGKWWGFALRVFQSHSINLKISYFISVLLFLAKQQWRHRIARPTNTQICFQCC